MERLENWLARAKSALEIAKMKPVTLVTNNTKRFENIPGLALADWSAPQKARRKSKGAGGGRPPHALEIGLISMVHSLV
jgi:hypothetical protein